VSKTDRHEQLWGAETTKAIANFPVSGEPIPPPVARWLGRIKGAAALANADLGLLDRDKADRIAAAAARIAAGELDDQFPIDVFQTGSGTSSNMNANEVIAALAGEGMHANDDVNMGQSSNDVFPSAVHLAALDETVHDLLPALDGLAATLQAKAEEFSDVVKSGRTHWMDAMNPPTQEQIGKLTKRVKSLVERGLVSAARQSTDRRAVTLRLLAAGARTLKRSPGPFAGVLPEALASLDQKTLKRMEADLKKLISALHADVNAADIPLAEL